MCKFHWSPTRTTGTLHGSLRTFMTTSRSVLLRMGDVSGQSCRLNQNTYFMFNNFSFSENGVVYEIRRREGGTVEPERPQMTIWHMRIACWIPKATNTHSEYIILILFSAAKVVPRTHLDVTLYVNLRCLSCQFLKPSHTVIPRLTKIIRSGITFFSLNIR